MFGFLGKFLDSNEKEINKLQPIVDQINRLEDSFVKLTDAELKAKTLEFKKRLEKGATFDDLLPEAFAAVREAAKRTIGQRHYDVQLIGGMILHHGKIAEMKTGEGKTLVATLSLYLNSLTGKGCHLVTVNDYLAKRDAQWMGQIFYALGTSVACIGHESSWLYLEDKDVGDEWKNLIPISRRDAYLADITYGTNNEFGFDYLRDNMVQDIGELRQRELNYAIVDEVDSILIDEARTPLIISAPAEESTSLYQHFADIARRLKEEKDYVKDEKMRSVTLTDVGMATVEKWLNMGNIYDAKSISLVHHLEEALKAEVLFKKNKDYVVKDGEVIIVDEFTGRMMPGRRYSEGLHQAIEAKEGVEVKRESNTLGTISFQNLFRLYEKLAGMTGTALTEAEEFFKIYKLEVVEIPTNRSNIRVDFQDQIYKNEDGKFKAVIAKIKELQTTGQPVLIGTISIQKSEKLSKMMKMEGIAHQVLNAKHHEREAHIVTQAGKLGAVTVATNMAGRGVDIVLGGVPPTSRHSERSEESSRSADARSFGRQRRPQDDNINVWEKDHAKVLELGGLFIIGTERHESRRIDNQLRGRAGRQGDPGASQFYVSMDDDLMRIFGGDRMKNMMQRLGLPDDQPIQHKLISRSIESAQKKVEGHNFDTRKHLVEYDDVANKHRQAIYKKRRKILELTFNVISTDSAIADERRNPLLHGKGSLGFARDDTWLHEEILTLLNEDEEKIYAEKTKHYGVENIRQLEKMVYLHTIDLMWVEHLNALEALREGIGLRGYGQRDPLVEYKQEAYNLFQSLLGAIENQVVEILMKAEIQGAPTLRSEQPAQALVEIGADESLAAGSFEGETKGNNGEIGGENGGTKGGDETLSVENSGGVEITVRKRGESSSSDNSPARHASQGDAGGSPITHNSKVGRNDPCPCGSGKKFKKCHGK